MRKNEKTIKNFFYFKLYVRIALLSTTLEIRNKNSQFVNNYNYYKFLREKGLVIRNFLLRDGKSNLPQQYF